MSAKHETANFRAQLTQHGQFAHLTHNVLMVGSQMPVNPLPTPGSSTALQKR